MLFGLDAYAPLVMGALLLLLFTALALEIKAPEVVAIGMVAVLLLLHALTIDDVLAAVGNTAPLTIVCMFIVSAALVRTGTLEWFTTHVTGLAKRTPGLAVGMLLGSIAAISAFTNNTPLVMVMIPIGMALAKELKMAPSRLLMPISFAAILGGTCTLLGTSTNILVDGVARKAGLEPFGIFEIAPVGVVVAIAGVIWLTISHRWLPERTTVSSLAGTGEDKRYLVSIFIEAGSPYIGIKPKKADILNSGRRKLIDVIRGDASLRREMDDCILEEGDILVLRTWASDVLTIQEQGRLALKRTKSDPHLVPLSSRKSVLVETLLVPGANVIGHTLAELRLRRRYGVYPIALHRKGTNLEDRFESVPLEVGDTLLIEGAPDDLQRLVDDQELVNIAEPTIRGVRWGKAPLAVAVMIGIIAGAALDLMPLPALAVLGVAVVLATGCVEPDEAFKAVDWRIIALIIAMLAIGTALERSGLVEEIVAAVQPYLGAAAPWVGLAAIYLISLTLTEVVTNNAVAVVVTPIAIGLAEALGADPRPFVVAVMFAASASFLTPIGYQTNTLVYGAGGYRFTDFYRFGTPLTVVVAITTLIMIPMIWPL